ncbi:hypothetical protein Q3G72_001042 [Acer saccharum]|nr:hypothetical protein Q3G72_001042 [Acer saccharum]
MGNSRRRGTKGKQVAKDGGRPLKKRKPSVPVIGSPKGKGKMDANQKANMTEFANLNHRMDAFQKALVQSGLQFPYVRGQTNGSENTPQ